jgi:hypothetical protein
MSRAELALQWAALVAALLIALAVLGYGLVSRLG